MKRNGRGLGVLWHSPNVNQELRSQVQSILPRRISNISNRLIMCGLVDYVGSIEALAKLPAEEFASIYNIGKPSANLIVKTLKRYRRKK